MKGVKHADEPAKGSEPENFGEEVGRVVVGWHVPDSDLRRTAKFAHLEQLPVNVSRVLSRRETMAQVAGSLVSGAH